MRTSTVRRPRIASCGALAALLAIASAAFPEAIPSQTPRLPSSISLDVTPLFTYPMGQSADLFTMSGAARLGVEWSMAGHLAPFFNGGLQYAFVPVQAQTSLSVLSAEAGAGVCFWVAPRLGLRASVALGGWLGGLNGGGAISAHVMASGAMGLRYLFLPSVDLGLQAGYRYELGLYQGLEVGATTAVHLSGVDERGVVIAEAQKARKGTQGPRTPEKGRGIEIANVRLNEVFPVFRKYYDDHPVGALTLTNLENAAATGIRLSFLVKQFMDSAKECPVPSELKPGEQLEVPILALLTDKVLDTTEATKVAADLVLEYRVAGIEYRDARTLSVRFYDRNAMTWEDDRRAAAFVTAKDPVVLAFAKGAAGPVRGADPQIIDANLKSAMGIFSALALLGVSYVPDPRSALNLGSKVDVDYLQFPTQTLEYKSGDCDDLSILYAALLEAVGVETAFITVPGHIYLAVRSSTAPGDLQKRFSYPADLIVRDNRVWVPVEVTERSGGFVKAWIEGAKEWREGTAAGTAELYPVHEAWQVYEPVALPGGKGAAPPATELILKSFNVEVGRFVDREIGPRLVALQAEVQKTGGSATNGNRIGVLYAQYGRFDLAEKEFVAALEKEQLPAALTNLGNIRLLAGRTDEAATLFQRATALQPDNSGALLGLAKAYNASERYDLARGAYQRLAAVDKVLADRFPYLGGAQADTSRASEFDEQRREMIWAE